MSIGDNADCFFVILSGSVTVQIRNELIDSWDWAMSVYKALKEWKAKEFDKKVERQMAAHLKAGTRARERLQLAEDRRNWQPAGNASKRFLA